MPSRKPRGALRSRLRSSIRSSSRCRWRNRWGKARTSRPVWHWVLKPRTPTNRHLAKIIGIIKGSKIPFLLHRGPGRSSAWPHRFKSRSTFSSSWRRKQIILTCKPSMTSNQTRSIWSKLCAVLTFSTCTSSTSWFYSSSSARPSWTSRRSRRWAFRINGCLFWNNRRGSKIGWILLSRKMWTVRTSSCRMSSRCSRRILSSLLTRHPGSRLLLQSLMVALAEWPAVVRCWRRIRLIV